MQQEILDRNPKMDLRVYAVWFKMYGKDVRDAWPSDLLTDKRVTHLWDEPKSVGTWYAKGLDKIRSRVAPGATGLDEPMPILWDAYLLYSPEATWSGFPVGMYRWGRTIVNTRETLREESRRMR